MKKFKHFISIFAPIATTAAIAPIAVSCNDNPTVTCQGQRENVVNEEGDTFELTGQYTGEINVHFETIEEDVLVVVLGAFYQHNGRQELCKYVQINEIGSTALTEADKNGKFPIVLTALEIPKDKQPIEFEIKACVYNNNKIEYYTLTGFKFTYK